MLWKVSFRCTRRRVNFLLVTDHYLLVISKHLGDEIHETSMRYFHEIPSTRLLNFLYLCNKKNKNLKRLYF